MRFPYENIDQKLFLWYIIFISKSRGSNNAYHGGYASDYADEDDYEDYETRAARGDRNYFSDDPAKDYNSYYAQLADNAMMGDQDAMDELRGEFGDEVW